MAMMSSHWEMKRVEKGSNLYGLLSKALFACCETYLYKFTARSKRCQDSPSWVKQLPSPVFRFAKIYEQKTFQ
jgi:hypothetical protein